MRPFYVALILAAVASPAHAQFNTIVRLLNTFGLSKPLECVLPCVLASTNDVPCHESGAAAIICHNIDAIEEKTKPCTAECNAEVASKFVVDVVRYVCGHDGREAPSSEESSSSTAGESSGKAEDKKPADTEAEKAGEENEGSNTNDDAKEEL
ncbi:hypothetical protein GMORB2_3199 [Geosmithia morbida]|uniref:Extracellular membrane protein CFEM domain-containing protein n=1 Tax=Geosmithia morbida TaxID=1094350 RepID=A0A9P4YNV3_9HYPO|nr:uncharacterized protein GMORB2_3199 [Geosmithia morbida]KAF4120398.1 hypothetical protein GMORB2_3199 [Geosmithia morbida]